MKRQTMDVKSIPFAKDVEGNLYLITDNNDVPVFGIIGSRGSGAKLHFYKMGRD